MHLSRQCMYGQSFWWERAPKAAGRTAWVARAKALILPWQMLLDLRYLN
jgi:hypothetical protein